MKKNRPGILLQLRCSRQNIEKRRETLLQDTTTLCLRYHPVTVHRMERRFMNVQTEWGSVIVKEGSQHGEVFQSSTEYEDCKAIAQKHKVPLKKVHAEVWKLIDQ